MEQAHKTSIFQCKDCKNNVTINKRSKKEPIDNESK